MPSCPLILVVDDEATVAQLMVRALEGEGYAVLRAGDGEAALAVLRGLPQPVDLLIADIRMPRMGGDTLAFHAQGAGLVRRVLFVTGYDHHPETAQMLGQVLQKPFAPDTLCRMVGELLGVTAHRG